MRTGDLGMRDAEGYFRYVAREDDMITSAGYRIGPGEIEDCLTGHPDVVMAAAVGVPDALRGQVVRAFVVLRAGAARDGSGASLIDRVRQRISPHVAPRDIIIRDEPADDRHRQDHASRTARAGMAPEDALLSEAVDALFDDKGLGAGLEQRLATTFGRQAVFDLIATVGFYSTLGFLLNTYRPPLDSNVAAELEEQPIGGDGPSRGLRP
jgi:hypothetical protein